MAFIRKSNFEIIQILDCHHNAKNYFEVDDTIALPVSILNQKGYTTIGSCGGHPFVVERLLDAQVEDGKQVRPLADYLPDLSNVRFVRIRTYAWQRTYIEFSDPLPYTLEPPLGWSFDSEHICVYANYPQNMKPMQFFKMQHFKIKALLQWVSDLNKADSQ